MPAQIFGTDAVVTILNRAFNDISPSYATFNNQVAAAGTTTDSQTAFAKQFGAGYAGMTADALSTLLLGNIGVLPNAGLQTALKDYITSAGVANVGIVALQLGQILTGLENATGEQAAFKAAALAWNNEVTAAYNYSSNPANVTPSDQGPIVTPGATFTLIAGADTISPSSADTSKKSTSGDDVFRGDATPNSLETADSLDGGAGVDTLNVAFADAGVVATPIKPVLKNIEKIFVTDASTVTAGSFLSLADSTGVQEVWNKASVDQITVSAVALTTKVGLAGTVGVSTFAFASATGSNDTATLALNGATAAGLTTIADIETLNVAVTGGASSVTGLTAAAAKTLNVTGTSTAGVTLNGTYAAVTKFDASGYKGDLTVDLSTATTGVTVTGSAGGANNITLGAGNDTLKFTATSGSTISKQTSVAGFNEAGDKVDLSAFALGADTTLGSTGVTAAGDIAGFFTGTARAVLNDAADILYVDVNKDGNFNAGTDLAVKFTGGVTAAGFTIADIVLA